MILFFLKLIFKKEIIGGMKSVDINADMGESFGAYRIGNDEALLKLVTSANIACGFHAGDPVVMLRTVKACKENDVEIGAHPGFPDLLGFGRRAMEVKPQELEAYIIYQIGALIGAAKSVKAEVLHVKPHGALYNMAWTRRDYAEVIVRAVASVSKDLIVVAPYGSEVHKVAEAEGLKIAFEGFAERGYTKEGRLVPRGREGAIIKDENVVAERALRMVSEGKVKSVDGVDIELVVNTICIHSDSPGSDRMAAIIRKRFEEAGIKVEPMYKVVGRI